MMQETLLKHIQEVLPKGSSLIEAVATALDMSYDAAHRRTSLKSKFSLEESVMLAQYYKVSLDRLFDTTDINYVTVEKTKQIKDETELKQYFEDSYHSLQPLLKEKQSHILYSAKDIPLFYTIGTDLLSRFKIYVWLKLLDKSFSNKSFEQFSPTVSLLKSAKALGELYKDLNTTEIWDITTVNSTLKQIHFYNQAGLVSNITAIDLCDALKGLIKTIALKVDTDVSYKLYYNELLLMNNHVLVTTDNLQSLYVPFSILSYYQTSDKLTCKQAEEYLHLQLHNSKLLNTSGEREKRNFFNKINAKIEALQQLIQAAELLDFE
ncbi:MAG TPA: hypothetical protein VKZ97_04670 [Flavobacteriaceae bacterium]|nr:hypothetical protein [Flavobacteriaceae bacterium]